MTEQRHPYTCAYCPGLWGWKTSGEFDQHMRVVHPRMPLEPDLRIERKRLLDEVEKRVGDPWSLKRGEWDRILKELREGEE